MNTIIKKASLTGGIMLKYSYSITEGDVKNLVNISSDAPVHDDLRQAFRNMIPFFAHVCEEITKESLIKNAIKNPDEYLEKKEDDPEGKDYPFLKFRVYGFEIGGKDDSEGIKLIGEKWIEVGDWITFSTPLIRFDSQYKFANELSEAAYTLRHEVFEYMQGKQAPRQVQFDMFGSSEEEEGEEI